MDTRSEYRKLVSEKGKKEFTFLKMQEYGFWPSHLPTPYERQQNETEEDFENRKKLLDEFQKLSDVMVFDQAVSKISFCIPFGIPVFNNADS